MARVSGLVHDSRNQREVVVTVLSHIHGIATLVTIVCCLSTYIED